MLVFKVIGIQKMLEIQKIKCQFYLYNTIHNHGLTNVLHNKNN